MLTVPPGFLTALASSHSYTASVESYYNGALVGTVPFEDGNVLVDATNRVRRRIDDLAVPERYWPAAAGDLLSAQGNWLRATVTIGAGSTAYPAIPVFAGKLLRTQRLRRSGKLRVIAADPMWQVNRESFEGPRVAPVGTVIVELIRTLLLEVFPSATLEDQTHSLATVPTAGLVWDAATGSRGRAIDELAASIGAEVFARPTRVWPEADFMIRPVPSLDTGSPVWTVTDGSGGVVTQDQLELDGERVVNRWIVLVEPTSGSGTLYATATDSSPTSPTRYGGPMGKLVDFWSSPLISTLAQGTAAAEARLARSIGMADARNLQVIANPAMEAGDLIQVRMGTETVAQHIVDRIELPLTAIRPEMEIRTRSAALD